MEEKSWREGDGGNDFSLIFRPLRSARHPHRIDVLVTITISRILLPMSSGATNMDICAILRGRCGTLDVVTVYECISCIATLGTTVHRHTWYHFPLHLTKVQKEDVLTMLMGRWGTPCLRRRIWKWVESRCAMGSGVSCMGNLGVRVRTKADVHVFTRVLETLRRQTDDPIE